MAACREAKEEVGIIIKENDLQFRHAVHRLAEEGDHERVDFFFEAVRWEGEPTNSEPDKCDDVQWFDISQLPEKITPLIRQVLESIAHDRLYSDMGF